MTTSSEQTIYALRAEVERLREQHKTYEKLWREEGDAWEAKVDIMSDRLAHLEHANAALQQTCNGLTYSRDHWHRQYTSLLRQVKDTEKARDDARTETQLICDDYRQLQLDLQHRTDERDAMRALMEQRGRERDEAQALYVFTQERVNELTQELTKASSQRLIDERDAWRLQAERAQGEADRLREQNNNLARDLCLSEVDAGELRIQLAIRHEDAQAVQAAQGEADRLREVEGIQGALATKEA